MLVVTVVGNRPQFVKSAPLALAFRSARLDEVVLPPGQRSARQLESEVVHGRREIVGDVMADATRLFEPIARRRERAREGAYCVLTIHREANVEPERLRRIVAAVNGTGRAFVFPAHP